jgi:hypothetical protein
MTAHWSRLEVSLKIAGVEDKALTYSSLSMIRKL